MTFGLRGKITSALVVLSLVPLASVTAWLVWDNMQELEVQAQRYHLATADNVTVGVTAWMDRAVAQLRSVGATLSDKGRPVEQRMAAAEGMVGADDLVNLVALYSADGRSVKTFRKPGSLPGVTAPAALDKGLRKVVAHEDTAPLRLYRTEEGTIVLPMLQAVYARSDQADGSARRVVYGYLWTALDLAELSALTDQISQRRFGRETGRVYILGGDFRIIASGHKQRLWSQVKGRGPTRDYTGTSLPRKTGYVPGYEVDGVEMVGSVAPMDRMWWVVVVEQPAREVYGPVRKVWTTAVVVGLGAAMVALLVGLGLGRRLTRPILSVARASRQVADGAFDTRVAVKSSDEVGRMAEAFNTMAADLGDFRERVIDETRIRTNLSRYLSAEVVDQVVQQKADLVLGGQRREVTVLFADVVSFTPLAEKHPPEFVVAVLNELFSFLTEIVFRHNGIVDKFIGDCVMAVFGAPQDVDDPPLSAVRAAEEMMRWLEVGNAKWREDLGQDLQLAIGINSGPVLAGNVGSEKRMEYTVIGDVVNVAARLEALAQPGQVVMSAATARAVEDEFDTESLGVHPITGRGEPMEIFALDE